MKKLTILLLLFRSCSPSFGQVKNIYTPIYPIESKYIGKSGIDSLYNLQINTAHLDSLVKSYKKIDSTNNILKATGVLASQASVDAGIAKAKADSIVANWPSGGGGIVITPSRTINTSGFLFSSDLGKDIYINCSCTITVPALPDGWYCWAWRTKTGGTPTFKNAAGQTLGTISVKGGLVKIASSPSGINVNVR